MSDASIFIAGKIAENKNDCSLVMLDEKITIWDAGTYAERYYEYRISQNADSRKQLKELKKVLESMSDRIKKLESNG